MEVRAHLRYLRISPRKVRLVVNLVRGMMVEQAIDQLTILPKKSALPVMKLIKSAMANAEHNFKLDPKTLRIKSIVANEGPKLKRFQPRAFGRAAEILKKMSHVTVVLEDTAKSAAPSKKKESKPATIPAKKSDLKGSPVTSAVEEPIKPAGKPSKSPTAKAKARDAEHPTIRRQGTS